MKKIIGLLLCVCIVCSFFTGCFSSGTKKIEEYYNLTKETQELLDIVADDIYNNWHECIYEDAYGENIDLAIALALSANEENLDTIEQNTTQIKEMYSEIKESKLREEIKAVMQAYNEYYSFVVEVSGSFNSYSADKETLKKELATALKNLSFEL